MLLPLMMTLTALAQDAVTLSTLHTVYAGGKPPALMIKANVDTTELEVDVTCGGVRQTHSGPVAAQDTVRLEFTLPRGTHICSGTLDGRFSDGTSGKMPLEFKVQVRANLEFVITKDDLDIDAQYLDARLNHPIEQLMVEVFGPGGVALGSGVAPADVGSTGPHRVQWDQTPGEVVQLRVTAQTADGETGIYNLWPWSYQVPHEDLNFASGSDEVTPEEAPKLEEAMANIQAVIEKYGKGVGGFPIPIKLYVAGYTDTVGSSSSNKSLSTRRAKSIASWFRANGFERPIYVQGFGESGLIRPTADEVADPANRRALYMLSAQSPGTGPLIPKDDWRPLD